MNPNIIQHQCNLFNNERDLMMWGFANSIQNHPLVQSRLSVIQNGQESTNRFTTSQRNVKKKMPYKNLRLKYKLGYETCLYIVISKLFVLLVI